MSVLTGTYADALVGAAESSSSAAAFSWLGGAGAILVVGAVVAVLAAKGPSMAEGSDEDDADRDDRTTDPVSRWAGR